MRYTLVYIYRLNKLVLYAGKGYDQIKESLPISIEVACHNSNDNCTLTGPASDVDNFVQKLQSEGTFARAVNVANIAYHSKYIAPAAPKLLSRLKEVNLFFNRLSSTHSRTVNRTKFLSSTCSSGEVFNIRG